MKKLLTYSVVIVALVMGFLGCKKDKPATVYLGYDYFPNNVGHWVIYNVDSIVVNPLSSKLVDTFKFQVKEVIDSFYTDNTGRRTQVIMRYKKTPSDTTWVFQKTFTGNLTSTEALKKEDNITYVKLTFPVNLNANWNGGAFNNITDWNQSNFQYVAVNTPAVINGHYFDSTCTVLQDSTLDQLQHDFRMEQYATNVGLIYAHIVDMEALQLIGFSNSIPPVDSLWVPADYIHLIQRGEIQQGSIISYTQTYVSSGN